MRLNPIAADRSDCVVCDGSVPLDPLEDSGDLFAPVLEEPQALAPARKAVAELLRDASA
jgi:hypothetical protein